MAGYGVQERKTARETRANPHVCGTCGGRVAKHDTLCQACKDDIFFSVITTQVENEKIQSGDSQ